MTNVVITTAMKLPSTQLEQIKKAVSKKYGRAVTYQLNVDPSILGGLQITIGSRFLDGSVKGKLDQLQKKVLGQT